jgi:SHS2 domain-containing protein
MAEQGIEGEEHDAIMQRLESDFFPDNSAFDMMNSSDDMSADAEAPASDFPIDEARSSDINPDEIKALTGMQVDAAKARAQEIIAASTTGDNKKSYLANQINRARTTMDVVGLLYNMILAGEGNAVQGSRYGRKFGNAMEEAFDLQNGYDDINDASGNDYFPNGADSPVVTKVGPSGARQGDNPEQKKMQVAEVHKELVYGYRNYLKEAAVVKKKT